MRENRETPRASGSGRPDRLEKATSYKTSTHASGESDEQGVPAKRSNKEEQSSAEGVEGSCSTKGNTEEAHPRRTQGRGRVSQGLGGVREAALRDKKQQCTALLHHVTVDLLRDSYHARAAPGVDGVTWEQYVDAHQDRYISTDQQGSQMSSANLAEPFYDHILHLNYPRPSAAKSPCSAVRGLQIF
ncbi:MAG: hypothetical protein DMG58_14540 [Acidobacteria bacterium]|nr:MAG: hypothetical protein DMG58_14540 [Acidobacteriota bacterium]